MFTKDVVCPHCEGCGEEPGAPIDLKHGLAICTLCDGDGYVDEATAEEYLKEI